MDLKKTSFELLETINNTLSERNPAVWSDNPETEERIALMEATANALKKLLLDIDSTPEFAAKIDALKNI